jgi:hypothetical protein
MSGSPELRDKVAQALHGYNHQLAQKYRGEVLVPTWEDEPERIREHYRNAADAAIAVMQEVGK